MAMPSSTNRSRPLTWRASSLEVATRHVARRRAGRTRIMRLRPLPNSSPTKACPRLAKIRHAADAVMQMLEVHDGTPDNEPDEQPGETPELEPVHPEDVQAQVPERIHTLRPVVTSERNEPSNRIDDESNPVLPVLDENAFPDIVDGPMAREEDDAELMRALDAVDDDFEPAPTPLQRSPFNVLRELREYTIQRAVQAEAAAKKAEAAARKKDKGPLPPGWKEYTDLKTGRSYYVLNGGGRENGGITTWTRPTSSRLLPAAPRCRFSRTGPRRTTTRATCRRSKGPRSPPGRRQRSSSMLSPSKPTRTAMPSSTNRSRPLTWRASSLEVATRHVARGRAGRTRIMRLLRYMHSHRCQQGRLPCLPRPMSTRRTLLATRLLQQARCASRHELASSPNGLFVLALANTSSLIQVENPTL